jgi:hypothetical protein
MVRALLWACGETEYHGRSMPMGLCMLVSVPLQVVRSHGYIWAKAIHLLARLIPSPPILFSPSIEAASIG